MTVRLSRRLITLIRRVVYQLIVLTRPVVPGKVVFSNFAGGGYGGNPKYICEELLKDGSYELVWLVKPGMDVLEEVIPPSVRISIMGSWQYYVDMATAQFWISNTLQPQHSFPKRTQQFYLQSGHGSFGIKKVGFDTPQTSERRRIIENDARKLDVFVSNSRFETDVYARAFGYRGKILELGHPRSDILVNGGEGVRARLREHYGVPDDERWVLYLPTLRPAATASLYLSGLADVEKAFAERFGGSWRTVVRLHPRSRSQSKMLRLREESPFIDATHYPDVQELMVAADAAITDYSSAIFDFLLTERPSFVYGPDIDSFVDTTGLYFSYESSPLTVTRTLDELLESIKTFDEEIYQKAVREFLERQGSVEDGRAAVRFASLIGEFRAAAGQGQSLDKKWSPGAFRALLP